MMCEAHNPSSTFWPCGRANLEALRSVGISPAATPTRTRLLPKVRRQPLNSWERGIPTSSRPDGSQMPFLDDSGSVVGQKDWADKYRRRYQEAGLA